MKTNNGYSKFLTIWAAQFLSVVGNGLTTFALGYYLFSRTNSVSSYVLVLLCASLPAFIFKPLGGIFADRYDRKVMMLLGDLGASLGLLLVFYTISTGGVNLWLIYLGIALSSLFAAFHEPSYKTLVSDLLTEDQYANASGLVQLAYSAQYLISPFLAGILLSLMSIQYIFLIDFATFIVAGLVMLLIMRTIPKKENLTLDSSFIKDFKEGIKTFLQNHGIVTLAIIIMIVMFFVGLLQALFLPMILKLTEIKTAGIIQAICASGMIVGSLFLGIFGDKTKQVKVLSLGLLLAGFAFAGIGLSTNIVLITIAGFMFFAALPFVNTAIEVLIRKNIANEKQGRVWAIISNVTYLGSILAFVVAGFLADKIFNPLIGEGRGIALMFIISGIMIAITSIGILKSKGIERLETVSSIN